MRRIQDFRQDAFICIGGSNTASLSKAYRKQCCWHSLSCTWAWRRQCWSLHKHCQKTQIASQEDQAAIEESLHQGRMQHSGAYWGYLFWWAPRSHWQNGRPQQARRFVALHCFCWKLLETDLKIGCKCLVVYCTLSTNSLIVLPKLHLPEIAFLLTEVQSLPGYQSANAENPFVSARSKAKNEQVRQPFSAVKTEQGAETPLIRDKLFCPISFVIPHHLLIWHSTILSQRSNTVVQTIAEANGICFALRPQHLNVRAMLFYLLSMACECSSSRSCSEEQRGSVYQAVNTNHLIVFYKTFTGNQQVR